MLAPGREEIDEALGLCAKLKGQRLNEQKENRQVGSHLTVFCLIRAGVFYVGRQRLMRLSSTTRRSRGSSRVRTLKVS